MADGRDSRSAARASPLSDSGEARHIERQIPEDVALCHLVVIAIPPAAQSPFLPRRADVHLCLSRVGPGAIWPASRE
jgi:hypothetical protein